jgi:hypothetical protein
MGEMVGLPRATIGFWLLSDFFPIFLHLFGMEGHERIGEGLI